MFLIINCRVYKAILIQYHRFNIIAEYIYNIYVSNSIMLRYWGTLRGT